MSGMPSSCTRTKQQLLYTEVLHPPPHHLCCTPTPPLPIFSSGGTSLTGASFMARVPSSAILHRIKLHCVLSISLFPLSVALPVSLSVCLSLSSSIPVSVCVHIYVCLIVSVCLSVCACVYLAVSLPVCLFFCLPVCLSVCLSVWLHYRLFLTHCLSLSTRLLTSDAGTDLRADVPWCPIF